MPDPRAYRSVAALVRDQITSGVLSPGERLPSIGEFAPKARAFPSDSHEGDESP